MPPSAAGSSHHAAAVNSIDACDQLQSLSNPVEVKHDMPRNSPTAGAKDAAQPLPHSITATADAQELPILLSTAASSATADVSSATPVKPQLETAPIGMAAQSQPDQTSAAAEPQVPSHESMISDTGGEASTVASGQQPTAVASGLHKAGSSIHASGSDSAQFEVAAFSGKDHERVGIAAVEQHPAAMASKLHSSLSALDSAASPCIAALTGREVTDKAAVAATEQPGVHVLDEASSGRTVPDAVAPVVSHVEEKKIIAVPAWEERSSRVLTAPAAVLAGMLTAVYLQLCRAGC